MLILLLFLLASGDVFLKKLVAVMPRLGEKRKAFAIVRESNERSQPTFRHHAHQHLPWSGDRGGDVGVGMPSPLLWGVMVCVLNYVPYLGAIVSTAFRSSPSSEFDWVAPRSFRRFASSS